VAPVDLKSAFDSVDRQALWGALRGVVMAQFIMKLIEELHAVTTNCIQLGDVMSDSLYTCCGIQ